MIHNAGFDIAFINAELAMLGKPPLAVAFEDTLAMARKRYPGAPASLDALCKRFTIDNSARDKHGARLDCELLASVYLELIGGRQPALELVASQLLGGAGTAIERAVRPPRLFAATHRRTRAPPRFPNETKAPIWLELEKPRDQWTRSARREAAS